MRPPWVTAGPVSQDPASFPYELYDLSKDWTQCHNVADQYPDKLKEMEALFWAEAQKYQVLPLDATVATRLVVAAAEFERRAYGVHVFGRADGHSERGRAEHSELVVQLQGRGRDSAGRRRRHDRDAGRALRRVRVLHTHGKPVFLWNFCNLKRVRWEAPAALTPGKHVLEFDFTYDGLGMGTLAFNNMSGIGRGGTGVLKVDGNAVATQALPNTLPLILQWDENFDVGADTGTPVDDQDYQCPFTFTGTLDKLTLTINRPQLTPDDIKLLTQEGQRNNRASE